jgi:aminomethyltransferase
MPDDTPAKKTPLYSEHEKRGAKIIPFGGWAMPVQYTSIFDEHNAVRQAVGVFDISHMGQVFVSGARAQAWLNRILTNNVDRLDDGEGQYTFLLNENGGVIDDLYVFKIAPEKFFLVVNAAKTDEDVAWMQSQLSDGVALEVRGSDFAGLAVQGPHAAQLFEMFFDGRHSRPDRNSIKEISCDLMSLHVSRTGYTGEDGFEVFFPAGHAADVWNQILEKGAALGIKPCGLGARDTLRLEMCYPLNGSDLSPGHTPFEAGLSIFVDLEKPDFIGRDALARQKSEGVKRRLVPFKMKDKSPPPRSHYPIFKNGEQIGEVASGTMSPSLGAGIGMAYLPVQIARIGEEIEIAIRGRRFPAVIEKKPLYRKS